MSSHRQRRLCHRCRRIVIVVVASADDDDDDDDDDEEYEDDDVDGDKIEALRHTHIIRNVEGRRLAAGGPLEGFPRARERKEKKQGEEEKEMEEEKEEEEDEKEEKDEKE